MLAALLALALSQTPAGAPPPRTAVVISRRSGVSVGRGLEIGDAVSQALEKDGVHVDAWASASANALAQTGVLDTATCAGQSACVARLAGPLHARVVVGVDLAQVVDQLAVHVVALPAGQDVALADAAFVADAVDPGALAGQLAAFARQLQTALQALPPETAAPRSANLIPPMEGNAQVALHTSPPGHLARYLVTGAAVGAAAASVAFLASGLHQKSRLQATEHTLSGGVVTSTLTEGQAGSLRDVANRNLSIALAGGIVSAGLTGLAAYLWTGR